MAKVLIDMPTDYRFDTILGAIQNGIALDNLTNGEVIQKMFPNADVSIMEEFDLVKLTFEDVYYVFDLDWWNRKWGE